jgi:hypothetical protein
MMRTVLGAIGGVGGTQLAGMMGLLQSMLGEAAGQGSMIAGNAAASAVGGGLLTLIVGLIKQMMGGQKA